MNLGHGIFPGSAAPSKRIRASYDALAEIYTSVFADDLTQQPLERKILDELSASQCLGARILDLGCGPAQVARYLQGKGFRAIGLDISYDMLACAHRIAAGTRYVQSLAVPLPFRDGAFDIVAAFFSLVHYDDVYLRAAFQEIRRVLNLSGHFVMAFQSGGFSIHVDEWLGVSVDLEDRFLEVDCVVRLMESAGMSCVSRQSREAYDFEVSGVRNYLVARPFPVGPDASGSAARRSDAYSSRRR